MTFAGWKALYIRGNIISWESVILFVSSWLLWNCAATIDVLLLRIIYRFFLMPLMLIRLDGYG